MAEGSRFLKAPFGASGAEAGMAAGSAAGQSAVSRAQIAGLEQLVAVRFGALEQRLERIERGLDRIERRLWLGLCALAGALASQLLPQVMALVSGGMAA